MRPHHLLRVASTKKLCFFCTCRLNAELPPYRPGAFPRASATNRRHLNTTSQRESSEVAPASDQRPGGFGATQPSWTGFDAESSLSPAEQAEKSNRLQRQREQQTTGQRLQRGQPANWQGGRNSQSSTTQSRRQNQRLSGTRRLNLAQSQTGEAAKVSPADEKGDKASSNLSEDGVNERTFQGADSPDSNANTSATRRYKQAQEGHLQNQRQAASQRQHQSRDGHVKGKIRFLNSANSPNDRSEGTLHVPASTLSNNAELNKDVPATVEESKKITAPTFRSSSKAQIAKLTGLQTGWGSGGTETKPLEYGERKETVEMQSRQSNPSTNTIETGSYMQNSTGLDQGDSGETEEKVFAGAGSFVEDKRRRQETLYSASPEKDSRTVRSETPQVAKTKSAPNDVESRKERNPTQSVHLQSLGLPEEVNASNRGQTRRHSGGLPWSGDQESGEVGETRGNVKEQGFGLDNNDDSDSILLGQSAFPARADTSYENHAANWQHLRRQVNNHVHISPDAAIRPPPSQPSNQYLDDAWVDRSFEEHRRKRVASSRQEPVPAPAEHRSNNQINIFGNNNAKKRCARCGQLGHIARQCPGRSRTTCHTCGQAGHLANACPNDTAAAKEFGKSRIYLTDPYAKKPIAPVRRVLDNGKGPSAFEDPTATQRSTYSPTLGREETIDQTAPGDSVIRKQNGSGRHNLRAETSETLPRDQQSSENRSSRRKQWTGDEDVVEKSERNGDRRGQRRDRRRDGDDKDDELFARDEARARKQARLAKKEAERKVEREIRKAEQTTPITLPEFISVQNLSQALGVRYEQFVHRLEKLGYDDVFPGKILNTETSGMIAMEYNYEPTFDAEGLEEEERDLKARPEIDDKEFLPVRPPVVTIMGHVDHGKTTLLDYLRKSSVAAGEAGGITQHIGAFSVPLSSSGKTITFLDTPGHAAFLAMRQRGANVTDIVVLVVAADDSVKPQTLEAIKHAKAAGVPMIVAINKIDKEEADVQRCKQDLARHGVEIEDYGGDTQVVEVSGKTGKGMEDLEETVVTLSEILDHRAETDGDVEGWILEATTKKSGRVATVLVRRGTLRPGSVIVAGKTWARVKTLRNESDRLLDQAGPGMPIEVDGWKDQPVAGDEVLQAPSERKAASVVDYRLEVVERSKIAQDMEVINEARRSEQEKRGKEKAAEATSQSGDGETDTSAATADNDQTTSGQIEVPFIIKADVSGSAEAVSAYILGVSNPMIRPKILLSGVGAVNESDIELASVAQGCIIAFNLRPDSGMNGIAEAKGVRVLENNIIYRVLDDVKTVMEDKLPPVITQRVLGEADVAASFEIGIGGRKKMNIAGCKVRNGVITKGNRVRVMRKGVKVYDGTISSLKNVKKDVQEMRKGSECGISFNGFEKFEVSDQVQVYEEVSERRRL